MHILTYTYEHFTHKCAQAIVAALPSHVGICNLVDGLYWLPYKHHIRLTPKQFIFMRPVVSPCMVDV